MTSDPETPTGSVENEDRLGEEDEGQDDLDTSMMDAAVKHTTPNGQPSADASSTPGQSLFSNPPNLGPMRQRLFSLETPIEMPETDFNAYFPFVDNIWRKNRTGDTQKDSNVRTDTYWCRTRRSPNYKAQVSKPTPEGKQSRRKRTREEKDCGMEMKVMYKDGAVRSCTISKSSASAKEHTHDLDYMDELKRNTGIMHTARREANRGYLPASVHAKLWEEPDKMTEAGGKHLKVSDVRNVQYAWRQDHLEVVLRDHSGKVEGRTWSRVKKNKAETPNQTVYALPPTPTPIGPTTMTKVPPGMLRYPDEARPFLERYLPDQKHTAQVKLTRPHVTLTYAQSLDGRISLMQGIQTAISGPETKAMTHYIRSRHDAILVGVRTAIADDPGLNCRLLGAGGYGGTQWHQQPRPIIIDPHARLYIGPEMKMLKLVGEGRARAPWIIVPLNAPLHPVAVSTLKAHGGEYLQMAGYTPQTGFSWDDIFGILFKEGIKSIMVEGGGIVLSELLKAQNHHLIDSIIVTIAPTYMGKAGTSVAPDPSFNAHNQPVPTQLSDVSWQPMGDQDMVMCGKVQKNEQQSNGILQGIEEFSNAAATTQPQQGQYSTATAAPEKG